MPAVGGIDLKFEPIICTGLSGTAPEGQLGKATWPARRGAGETGHGRVGRMW
jgi:hypothetical protein